MNQFSPWRCAAPLLTALVCGMLCPTARAQLRPQAILGQPFGVAEVSLPLPVAGGQFTPDASRCAIFEKNGRVLYPAVAAGRFPEVAAELLGEAGLGGLPPLPTRLNISFLFTGSDPLELTILTPQPQQLVVTPAPPRRPRDLERAVTRWWKDYHAVARGQHRQGDYPPLIETYLTSMLSHRLGLQPPLLTRMQESESSELANLLGLLFGVEELRFALLRETMQGRGLGEAATLPLPAEVNWQPLALPPDDPQVAIEPIARHVPEDCFYVRFGRFENYLWFDHLKDDYGGNISQMVTLRGHNAGLDEKVQQQLSLKQTALSEALGPQVVSDVALIGRDLYLREGPAIGMLFEARNSALFGTNLQNDRQTALREWKASGATLETVSIAGRDVSFLSTPDHRLRSFYAVDGDYHLVTTTRAIVERFYEVADGAGSLGASAEFQHARRETPLERDDTIFAYLSSAFFRGLFSPRYQVELARRLQSVTDMELVQLARLAAAAEGQPDDTVDALIAGGFLPRGFGTRGDGAPPVDTENGFFDPRRGLRGYFTPIPDMDVHALTPSEAALSQRALQFLQTQWPQMDPLQVAVKRFALEPERMERIVIDANVSPLAEEKYGWVLSLLGPPTTVQVQSDPRDVVTMQMSLQGGLLQPAIPAHQVFLGIQDLQPDIEPVPSGFLQTLKILRSTPGYLGAWPQMGLLDLIPFLTPPPDVFGFSQLPLGLWRWQGNGFSVLSFHQNVLAEAATFLQPVATDNAAQIQVRVSNLANSQLAGWVSALNYSRALQTSTGNVRLLDALTMQLRIAPEQALEFANQLLDTQLVCTLGGEYQYVELPDGSRRWQSSRWTGSSLPPPDYTAPLLEWFRGATLSLTKDGNRMFAHAEVDMLRKPREPAVELPLFNLFGGKKQDPAEEKP